MNNSSEKQKQMNKYVDSNGKQMQIGEFYKYPSSDDAITYKNIDDRPQTGKYIGPSAQEESLMFSNINTLHLDHYGTLYGHGNREWVKPILVVGEEASKLEARYEELKRNAEMNALDVEEVKNAFREETKQRAEAAHPVAATVAAAHPVAADVADSRAPPVASVVPMVKGRYYHYITKYGYVPSTGKYLGMVFKNNITKKEEFHESPESPKDLDEKEVNPNEMELHDNYEYINNDAVKKGTYLGMMFENIKSEENEFSKDPTFIEQVIKYNEPIKTKGGGKRKTKQRKTKRRKSRRNKTKKKRRRHTKRNVT